MKKRNIGIIILLIALAVGGFAVYKLSSSLDALVEVAIETYGTDIIGAKVEIESVNLDLSNGTASLNGLVVSNPEGFKTAQAISLGQAKLVLDIDSITSDVIIIKEVLVQAPSLTYEMATGGSNIDTIARNAEEFVGESSGSDSNNTKDGPKLIIEDFIIRDGNVNVSHKVLSGKAMTLKLADIHLQNIGKENNGLTPGEVTEQVLDSLKSAVGTAFASSTIENTLGAGVNTVKKGASKIKGLFK